jgi:cytochrome b6-f complex iron-sulfur subunit
MDRFVLGRRRLLEMAALGAVAAGCGPGGVSPQSLGDVPAGNESDLSVGSLEAVGGNPLAIGRDSAGIYAMTLTCTHAGCEAQVDGRQIVCPCHGSTYDANGNVTGGPAPSPLDHFAVSADGSGNLTIHTGTIVPASTRLKV